MGVEAGEKEQVLSEGAILAALKPLIQEVTGAAPERITLETVIVEDLGAESLDLLDLSFLIEERFGITIEADEFERRARARMGGEPYERDGCLTGAALAELRTGLPEIDPARLAPGLRKTDLPALLTTAVFVHLIERKLAEKGGSNGNA